MKKQLAALLAAVAVLVAGTAWAQLECSKPIDNQSVSSTAVWATSEAIKLWDHRYFGYQAKCTSAGGTAEFDLEFHTAMFNDPNMRVQSGTDLLSGDTSEAWTTPASITPTPAAFGWFIVKGAGSNPTDSLCTVVFCQD